MRAGSLFSGVGGLDLGLHRAGFEHAFFCESDPWRRTVLAHHWPGVPIYEDVREVAHPQRDGRRRSLERTGGNQRSGGGLTQRDPGAHVDLLCGGFPCQDLSVAGKRAGLAGNRSGLFFEFARIIDALRPGWVLIENVPGLLSSNGGRDFGVVLGTLADIGYGVGWRVVDSRFFGVPQRRRRVFIVGARVDGDPRAAAERAGQVLAVGTRCPRHPPPGAKTGQDTTVASLSGLGTGGPDDNDGQAGRVIAVTETLREHPRPGSNSNGQLAAMNLRGREGGAMPKVDDVASLRAADGGSSRSYVAGTLKGQRGKAGGGIGPEETLVSGVAVGVRRLTPVECERLQAWPDQWTNPAGDAPDSRRYAACGDGVTASVAEWIGRRLIKVGRL